MQIKRAPKRGPTRAERHSRRSRAALSAQQTIPYVRMLPDGVCQLPGGLFTKTLAYEDINYSVVSTEDKSAIFNGWSEFLNYFDSSIPFQLTFINRCCLSGGRCKINIPPAHDEFDSIHKENRLFLVKPGRATPNRMPSGKRRTSEAENRHPAG